MKTQNLLGKIIYQIALRSYAEGVLEGAKNPTKSYTAKEFETTFKKIWFKVQIVSVNKINDETIHKTSDEILKLYFK